MKVRAIQIAQFIDDALDDVEELDVFSGSMWNEIIRAISGHTHDEDESVLLVLGDQQFRIRVEEVSP